MSTTTATPTPTATVYRQAADALAASCPQYRSSDQWSRLIDADYFVRFRGAQDAPDIRTACRRTFSPGDMVEHGLY